MGLLSFLTGKKEETPVPSQTDGGAGFSRPVADAPTDDVPAEGAASRPDTDTPFTPPEAWNIDALMAPPPEPTGEKPDMGPVDAAETAALQGKIIEAVKTVYDPEIPVDIYELGLIYEIIADAERRVLVRMTLTSPACPSAQQIPSEVRYKIKALPEVKDAWVEIVWEPPWGKERMSEAAKLQLGFL